MSISQLKQGSILSESSFFIVKEVTPTTIIVKDDLGNEVKINHNYVNSILNSADFFNSEEKKTMTELAEIFISSPRIAMTVSFYKQNKKKTNKDYEAERDTKIAEIQNATMMNAQKLLVDLIENPISRTIPGELRVMKGRHYGDIDDLGRVKFIDMEVQRTKTDHDDRLRQVDPRSIQHIIVGGKKYTLKK